MPPNRLGKPPLRAASIKLILNCSGGEQWSEHFRSSHPLFQPRLSSVRAAVCRLIFLKGLPRVRRNEYDLADVVSAKG